MGADRLGAIVAALRDLQILDPTSLDEIADEAATGAALADALRRAGLTPYQVATILDGRAGDLVLGPYLLLEPLGEGGMGRIFKARHRTMKRVVALKVIRGERRGDPEAGPRFAREIEAIAQLSHPNIVIAHDAAEWDGTLFFVMEFVEGIDLAALLRRHGPLPVAEACDYARQAALGLQHIHERGLVHRDIKPSNLLRADAGGIIKILDLGLVRLDPEATDGPAVGLDLSRALGLTGDGRVFGTPDYLPPEQAIEPCRADIRADIYSLGCTLYHLLAGTPPFPGGTAADKVARHQEIVPVPLHALRPDVPRALGAIVATMMAHRREDRYPAPGLVAEALAPFAEAAGRSTKPGAGPVGEIPTELGADHRSTVGGHPALGNILAAGLLALSAAGLLALFGSGRRPGPAADLSPTARATALAYRDRGKKYSIEGQDELALAALSEAIRLAPEDLEARTGRAWVQFKRGRLDLAFSDLDEVLRRDRANLPALDLRGWLYLRRGKLAQVLADCNALLRLQPAHAAALRHRAQCYVRLGQPERAEADFDAAVRSDPSVQNHLERGAFRSDRGQTDLAIADFNAALRLDPISAPAYHGRGIAHARRGEDRLAIPDFDRAIRLAPSEARYYANRGRSHARLGHRALAEADELAANRLRDRNTAPPSSTLP